MDLVPERNRRLVHFVRILGLVSTLPHKCHSVLTACSADERVVGSPIRSNSSSASTHGEPQSPRSTQVDHSQDVLRQTEKDKTVQQLTDRVHQLENILRLSTQPSQSDVVNELEDSVSQPRVGQFVKSKFYGESHWNNVLEPVRDTPVLAEDKS